MYGSHDMRHTGFQRLTVINGTPGFGASQFSWYLEGLFHMYFPFYLNINPLIVVIFLLFQGFEGSYMILGISSMIATMTDLHPCPRVWDDSDSLQ